ncbi:hypothetical protein BH09PSE1_BH09PSE1_05090 [soil metagenome]
MKLPFALAIVLGLATVTSAGAAAQQVASVAATPPATLPSAAVFAGQIRDAVTTVRQGATMQGLTGQALELAVSSAVETLIATSGQTPATTLAAVQTAMAEEKCTVTSAGYAIGGCQALADIASAISAAIGGPAASGGTGAVASAAAAGPPLTAVGSDYGI